MRSLNILLLLLLCSLQISAIHAAPDAVKPKKKVRKKKVVRYPALEIGKVAPAWGLPGLPGLPGVDGKVHKLSDYKQKVLAIVFTCNHCPTAQAYEVRLNKLQNDYADKDFQLIGISTADPKAVRLNELGYTFEDDSFDAMKKRAKRMKYTYPYLYDGETQKTSIAYGPAATPHIYIFDQDRKLRYRGAIDDDERARDITKQYARAAIDALLADKAPDPSVTRVFGCSTKWAYKRDSIKTYNEDWAKKEVGLEEIDLAGIKDLVANKTEKLRLINVWATWCAPCVFEFPELIKINRQFETRSFELITISTDSLKDKEKVHKFLKDQNAAITNRIEKSVAAEGRKANNYILNFKDHEALVDAIDKEDWQGPVPFTLLIAPGGKVLWKHEGEVDMLELKKAIVEHVGHIRS